LHIVLKQGYEETC